MNRRTVLKSLIAAQAVAALPAPAPAQAPAQASTSAAPRAVEEIPKVAVSVPDSTAEPVAQYFSKEQFAALAHLGELLEPSSSQVPGAREACAAEFLDFLLSQSPSPRQVLYRTGLDRLNSDSMHRFHQPFAALDAEKSAVILEPLRRPWTYDDPSDPLEAFLRAAKTDFMEATRNSYEVISVASKRSRRAGGVGEFWYPLY